MLQYICILVAVECNLFKNNYGIISGSVCAINAVTIRKGDQSLVIEHFKAVFQLLSSLIAYETYIKCHEMWRLREKNADWLWLGFSYQFRAQSEQLVKVTTQLHTQQYTQ